MKTNYKNKLTKYQKKNNNILNMLQYGGTVYDDLIHMYIMYDSDIRNKGTCDLKTIDIFLLLAKVVNPINWISVPNISDIGIDIFDEVEDPFYVTKYWHADLKPHSNKIGTLNCSNCNTTSKEDKRAGLNIRHQQYRFVSHHVDQHLFKISEQFLYTYHLVTCSVICLMQDKFVGMMHIDATNIYDDIIEFINAFVKKVGKINYNTIQMYGFFNKDMFDNEICYRQICPIFELIMTGYYNAGQKFFNNVHMTIPSSRNLESYYPFDRSLNIFIIPLVGIKGYYTSPHLSADFNVNFKQKIPQYMLYNDVGLFTVKIYEQLLKSPRLITERIFNTLNITQIHEICDVFGINHSIGNIQRELQDVFHSVDNYIILKRWLIDNHMDYKYYIMMYQKP